MPKEFSTRSSSDCILLRDGVLRERVRALISRYDADLEPPPPNLAETMSLRRIQCLIIDAASARDEQRSFLLWLADPLRSAAVLLLAGAEDLALVASCIEAGVDFYLRLPVSDVELSATIAKARALKRRFRGQQDDQADIVTLDSPSMAELYARARSVAPLDAMNVLLAGETGTGKQELARLIHLASLRRQGPFTEIDCASLPANLVESELFGHEAGAYTDARSRQNGLLESAQHGTLFLDEVGELPLEAQSKLLRALELRRFRRVGGREELQLDLRIVSASNRDLADEVYRGRFRADLYYRLNGVTLTLPPLRTRPEDIVTLAGVFYSRACSLFGRQALPLSRAVIDVLVQHAWPGNIRELKSALQRIVALAPPGLPISAKLASQELPLAAPGETQLVAAAQAKVPTLREAEESLARQALLSSGGNKTAAARLIGVSKPTFFRMLKQFGINS